MRYNDVPIENISTRKYLDTEQVEALGLNGAARAATNAQEHWSERCDDTACRLAAIAGTDSNGVFIEARCTKCLAPETVQKVISTVINRADQAIQSAEDEARWESGNLGELLLAEGIDKDGQPVTLITWETIANLVNPSTASKIIDGLRTRFWREPQSDGKYADTILISSQLQQLPPSSWWTFIVARNARQLFTDEEYLQSAMAMGARTKQLFSYMCAKLAELGY